MLDDGPTSMAAELLDFRELRMVDQVIKLRSKPDHADKFSDKSLARKFIEMEKTGLDANRIQVVSKVFDSIRQQPDTARLVDCLARASPSCREGMLLFFDVHDIAAIQRTVVCKQDFMKYWSLESLNYEDFDEFMSVVGMKIVDTKSCTARTEAINSLARIYVEPLHLFNSSHNKAETVCRQDMDWLMKRSIQDETGNREAWWPQVVRSHVEMFQMTLRGYFIDSRRKKVKLTKLKGLKKFSSDPLESSMLDFSKTQPQACIVGVEEESSGGSVLQNSLIFHELDRIWRLIRPTPTGTQLLTKVQVKEAEGAEDLVNILGRKTANLKQRTRRVLGIDSKWKRREDKSEPDFILDEQKELNPRERALMKHYQELALQREERKMHRQSILGGKYPEDPQVLCSIGNPYNRNEGIELSGKRKKEKELQQAIDLEENALEMQRLENEEYITIMEYVQAELAIYTILMGAKTNKLASSLAVQDFKHYAASTTGILKREWQVSMLDLVDLWTNTREPEEHILFLQQLRQLIPCSSHICGLSAGRQINRSNAVAKIAPGHDFYHRTPKKEPPRTQHTILKRWPLEASDVYLRSQAWSYELSCKRSDVGTTRISRKVADNKEQVELKALLESKALVGDNFDLELNSLLRKSRATNKQVKLQIEKFKNGTK